jgi:hypothetical protein
MVSGSKSSNANHGKKLIPVSRENMAILLIDNPHRDTAH